MVVWLACFLHETGKLSCGKLIFCPEIAQRICIRYALYEITVMLSSPRTRLSKKNFQVLQFCLWLFLSFIMETTFIRKLNTHVKVFFLIMNLLKDLFLDGKTLMAYLPCFSQFFHLSKFFKLFVSALNFSCVRKIVRSILYCTIYR